MSQLEEVYQAWQNNFTFREQFKKNPVTALKEIGLELNETDFKKIQHLLKIEENEELAKRINK